MKNISENREANMCRLLKTNQESATAVSYAEDKIPNTNCTDLLTIHRDNYITRHSGDQK